MGGKLNKQRGFTIVELLIVIVVIGILAAITIVAYNGVQQRANNTQRVTAAKDWHKLISAYIAQNGRYPSGALNAHNCLGTGNPTDFDVNPDEDCNGTGNIKHPSATINSAYMTIASKLPSFPGNKMTSSSTGTVAGIGLRAIDTLDPATTPKIQYPMLHYWLDGNNQDCVLRPIAQSVSGGYVESAAAFSANDAGLTRCIVLLPDPNAL